MRKLLCTLLVLFCAALPAAGCDDDGEGDGGPVGSLEITGLYDGALPDGVRLKWAIFECPFAMPPSDSGIGTVEAGEVYALIGDLPVGTWCILAFIDMDENDGLKQVDGLDPTAYPPEGDQSFEVEITENAKTAIDLTFTIRADGQ